jgi:hypothetical protein
VNDSGLWRFDRGQNLLFSRRLRVRGTSHPHNQNQETHRPHASRIPEKGGALKVWGADALRTPVKRDLRACWKATTNSSAFGELWASSSEKPIHLEIVETHRRHQLKQPPLPLRVSVDQRHKNA